MNGNLEYIKNNLKVPKGFSWDDPFNRNSANDDELIRLQDKKGNEIIFNDNKRSVGVILIDESGDVLLNEVYRDARQVLNVFYSEIFPLLNESEIKVFLYSHLSFKEFLDLKSKDL